jgi:stage V sporulation protein AD
LLLGTLLIDGGHFQRVGCISSSHFCSAERQFRTPLEYGGQRAPSAQWTVTGAGGFILEKNGNNDVAIDVTEVLAGKTQNGGIDDPSNMGAAMAPAALDTLLSYFRESGRTPSDFDLILTGDLGFEGSEILKELSKEEGYSLEGVHNDCGLLIFDRKKQDVHAGGSGCGCAATVLSSEILPKMLSGRYKNVLFMATGALMSVDSLKQGLTIPAIAHLVHLERREGGL